MEYELSTEEKQVIEHELANGLQKGGIDAATAVINRLAIEAVVLGIYHDEFVHMEHTQADLLQIRKVTDLAECFEIINFADDTTDDYRHAMSRHSYALLMLYDSEM